MKTLSLFLVIPHGEEILGLALDLIFNSLSEKKRYGKEGKGSEQLFYFEKGLVVYTETFHLKRGYCCKNGCRHCPYGFNKK